MHRLRRRQLCSRGRWRRPTSPSSANRPASICAGPNRLVGVAGKYLFVHTPGKLDSQKFPVPLHFNAQLPIAVVADKNLSLDLPSLSGGKQPFDLTLAQEYPGIELKAGKIEIRAQTVADRARDKILVRLVQDIENLLAPEEAIDAYVGSVTKHFERITGSKPAGIPVWMAVTVLAHDADMQQAEIERRILR